MKQKHINQNWKEFRLGDKTYFEIIGSGIKKFEGSKEFLSTKCIKYDKIKMIEGLISLNNRPSRANMQPRLNSVWFAKMKDTIKTYRFSEENPEDSDKYILSTGFSGILLNQLIYPRYLQFYFLTKEFNKAKNLDCVGGTQKAINNSKIAKLMIPLPILLDDTLDLEKQKQIVAILEKSEELKDKRTTLDELFDEYLRSVFYDMFLKDEFDIKELGSVCDIIMGQSPDGDSYNEKKNGIPFFQGKTEFGEKYTTNKKYTTKPTKFAKKNNILMSVRAPVGSVNFANCDCCIGRGLCSFEPHDDLLNDYLYYYFKLNEDKIAGMGTGSTFKAITGKQIHSLNIPVPPLPLQQKFASIVEQVEIIKDKLQNEKKDVNELFNVLMQKAFSGELI